MLVSSGMWKGVKEDENGVTQPCVYFEGIVFFIPLMFFFIPLMFSFFYSVVCLFLKHSFSDYSVSGALPETRDTKKRQHIDRTFRYYWWYENSDYCPGYCSGKKQTEVGLRSFRKVFVGVTVTEKDVNKISELLSPGGFFLSLLKKKSPKDIMYSR